VPTNIWNRVEEIRVSFPVENCIINVVRDHCVKFRNTKGCSKDINCNIGVKQGFPLSHMFFGMYINKLEGCLEEVGCVDMDLVGIVIILLLYVDDIILMVSVRPSYFRASKDNQYFLLK